MAEPSVKRIRTCIGCQRQAGKTALKRIVRCPDGSVRFDATGRLPGRGAYVCSVECMNAAFKAKKLQRALKANVEKDDAEQIAAQLSAAFAGDENDRS